MNSVPQKSKQQKSYLNKKVLEQLGELSTEALNTASSETKKITSEMLKQILGIQDSKEKKSGTIEPGGSVNLDSILSEKDKQNNELKNQIRVEHRLFEEIKIETEKKLQDLRFKLNVLADEAKKLAKSTVSLSNEAEIAAQTMPKDPGEYHIAFIQNLIEYLATFRKKVDSAVNWLAESNVRKQKKNYWSMYKKKGASFLLSNESYYSRSTG